MPSRDERLIHRRGWDLAGVGIDHEARGVDRFERARGDPLELADQLVGPLRRGFSLEEKVGAVVGEDEPVALHRHQHDLGLGTEAREAEVGFEAEPRAHRRQRWIARRASLMTCRPHIASVGAFRGEADRVIDETASDLVVPEDARPDREPGRIGARPSRGTKCARLEVEHGA